MGVPKVLLTTSCTHALEMAALLLDIKPDDEVIVPSFTFVSTINAFVLRGAKPVFIDIRPDTLNLDEKQLERLITKILRQLFQFIMVEYLAKWILFLKLLQGMVYLWLRIMRMDYSGFIKVAILEH